MHDIHRGVSWFFLCVMWLRLRDIDYIWQEYLWSLLSKEQNKNLLFGTTTRRYMQSKIVATIGHATRRAIYLGLHASKQRSASSLKAQETQIRGFWTPLSFLFTFIHLFI
jgi:hypothetical protein